MKKLFLILVFFSVLSSNVYSQNTNTPPKIPKEVSQWSFVIGKWSATNKSIARDGSGKYVINEGLVFVGKELFDGYGHQVDWYGSDGSYWGTSLRTFNRVSKKWESRWFDIVSSSWQDLHELEYKENVIIHESSGSDGFGKFKSKRMHTISKDGKTYEYKHLRKYESLGDWIVTDSFLAKRVE